jgi:hypothetical protein
LIFKERTLYNEKEENEPWLGQRKDPAGIRDVESSLSGVYVRSID